MWPLTWTSDKAQCYSILSHVEINNCLYPAMLQSEAFRAFRSCCQFKTSSIFYWRLSIILKQLPQLKGSRQGRQPLNHTELHRLQDNVSWKLQGRRFTLWSCVHWLQEPLWVDRKHQVFPLQKNLQCLWWFRQKHCHSSWISNRQLMFLLPIQQGSKGRKTIKREREIAVRWTAASLHSQQTMWCDLFIKV